MRKFLVLAGAIVVSVSLAAPAHATQPSAKKYASCEKLLVAYPNGVAQSKKAANKAARAGLERPRVSKAIYAANRGRLDRDRDGVLCEQQASAATEDQAPESNDTSNGVLYIPTGIRLLDVVYGARAERGEITQDQSTFIYAYVSTLAQQGPAPFCSNWKSRTFQDAFLGTVATPEVAASSKLPGQETWIRETASMLTTMYCVDKGYSYTILSP